MLPDFLTGSPLSKGGDKSDKKKDSSGKKHGMFHIGSPLKRKEKESPKSDKKGASSPSPQESDQVCNFTFSCKCLMTMRTLIKLNCPLYLFAYVACDFCKINGLV